MSLRAKLFLLCFLSVGVVVTPILYFTYSEVRQKTFQHELASFNKMARLAEEAINQRYLALLTQRVTAIMQRKESLQRLAVFARDVWLDVSSNTVIGVAEQEKVIQAYMDRLRELEVSVEIIGPSGRLFPGSKDHGFAQGIELGITDFKGRPLKKLLQSNREFAVLNLPQADGTIEPVLVFFLQIPEKQSVLMTMLRIADLEDSLREAMALLMEDTKAKIRAFELYPGGFITILDAQGDVLIHHGAELGRQLNRIPGEVLVPPQQQGFVQFIRPMDGLGEMLFSVLNFGSMEWTVIFAAPLSEIEAPSRALVEKLIYMACGGIALVLLLSMLAVAHLTRPLGLLVKKIRYLPDMDFASSEAEKLLAEDLPVARKDELGQMARAFSRMGSRLSANIRDLMAVTAATERMQGELNAAREIQRSILPPPRGASGIPGLAVAAFLEPAKEVGGDLYDFFALPNDKWAVIVGDVSDKGVPAALFMSMTVTLVRSSLLRGEDAATVMTLVNENLSANNAANMFVTLFIGVYDPATGHLEYANGGHCLPLVRSPVRSPAPSSPGWCFTLRELEGLSGPVVGALPGLTYTLLYTTLLPDDLCFVYTDGVSEAMNEAGDFFGMERMQDVLQKAASADPAELLDAVYAAVAAFRGNVAQSDDITMLAFTAKHEAPHCNQKRESL